MILLSGVPGGMIHPPMLIFKNSNCTYPILGVADDVPGVSYRTCRKGWMNRIVFHQWLADPVQLRPFLTGIREFFMLTTVPDMMYVRLHGAHWQRYELR